MGQVVSYGMASQKWDRRVRGVPLAIKKASVYQKSIQRTFRSDEPAFGAHRRLRRTDLEDFLVNGAGQVPPGHLGLATHECMRREAASFQ